MSTETISQTAAPATQTTEAPAALPTINEIAQSLEDQHNAPAVDPNAAPAVDPNAAPAIPDANQWAALTEQQRNVHRERERIRKEKQDLLDQKAEQDGRFKNLESVVDEFMGTDPENQPGQADFDPVKYKEELRAEVMKDVKGFQEETQQKAEETKQVTEFKKGVTTFLNEKSTDFPLASSMNQSDLVFEVIQQQYQKDIAEFGQEYASANMLTKEAAAKQAETHLASEVTKMLQSESVRGYLTAEIEKLSVVKDPNSVENQLNPGNQSLQAPTTLTNNMAQTSAQTQFIDETVETDEDAFNRALSLVP